MSSFEQIGKVSLSEPETEIIQPRGGVAFRFNYEGASEFYDVTLRGDELDRVVLNGVARGLGLAGCNPYDFEVKFPRNNDNLFVVCMHTRNSELANGDFPSGFSAQFKFASRAVGYYPCGILLAEKNRTTGWVSRGYAKSAVGASLLSNDDFKVNRSLSPI